MSSYINFEEDAQGDDEVLGEQDYDYFTDEIDASFAQEHNNGAESERSPIKEAPMRVVKPETYKESLAKEIFSNNLQEGPPTETGVPSSSNEEISPQRRGVHSSSKEEITPQRRGVPSSSKEEIPPRNQGVHSVILHEYTPCHRAVLRFGG